MGAEQNPRSPEPDAQSAERRLRETTRRLELALSAGQLGDWSWDARTDVVTFGDRGARMFGLAPGASVTWTALRERLHPDDRDSARRAVDEALATHGDYAGEYRVRKDDGSEAWLAAKGSGVYADDGSVLGMSGLVQDVTERRRSDESGRRLVAIVESSDDAIVSKSLDGTITSWNRAAERIFGYTSDEIVGRSVLTLIPRERHAEERQILETLMRGERIDHYETMRLRKDGTQFPVSLTVSPVRDERGRIVGASKIARDITARKVAEERVREESRVLNLLNETGRYIAGDLDPELIVQKVTDAATALSGAEFGAFFYNVSDENGNTYQLYTLSGAPRAAFEQFGQPRATALFGPTYRGEGIIRSDDVTKDPRYGQDAPHHGMPAGHLPVRSYLAVPVVSRSGEVVGGLFFGHSSVGVFTQRAEDLVAGVAAQAAIAIDNARLYERLRRASEERQKLLDAERAARTEAERVSIMKDEFLATLSHELRTPLNAILGWAQILHTRTGVDAEITEGLAVISRNARVQAQLIEDLLDMSRIISGKIRLDVQSVDLQDVVASAVESVRPSAAAKQLRLETALDGGIGPVWGDPNRLQQCIWNLVSNAIKFTPKGGRVRISLARVDGHVEIAVADDGQGIDPAVLPHVFERFRQGDSSTTRHHGGLGLGLSIVRSLVELHGGTVHAESAGPGRGATFRLVLPELAAQPSANGERRGVRGALTADSPALGGLTIVVVDDEPDARRLVKRILEDCGASVLSAESAREGLELIRSSKPQLLISDIGMPHEDGYEFIRKVRLLPAGEGGRTPAVALSAFARAEDRTRALRAGYQTHIAKPVDPAELAALVASLATAG